MRWLLNTVARVRSAFLLLVLLCLPTVVAADGKTAGSTSGNAVLQRYGTKESMNQNVSAPMTNSAASMQTLDGNTNFNATSNIPSSHQFLQIMIQPVASGDLGTVIVAQDLNTDGSFDHTFALGIPVSGVCANGFISCVPSTWNNCQSYKWQSDDTGRLSFTGVAVTQLGGCYCINSSCGSSLAWTNSSIVLGSLGGGAVGAIHATDASVMISSVSTDITTISYYGQLVKNADSTATDSVTALTSIPTVPQQQAYFANWSLLDADKGSVALTQSGNPDSMYYQIANSPAVQGNAITQTCSITRSGVVSSVPVASFSSTGSSSLCVDELMFMQIKKINDQHYELKLLDTGPASSGSRPHWNCNDNPGGDGWHLQHTINLPAQTGSYQARLTKALYTVNNIHGAGCIAGGSVSMDGVLQGFNTSAVATAPCPEGGAQTAYFDWSYLFEYETDTYQETVSDGCASYANDSSCRLKSEIVDDVLTYRNFGGTGLNPLPTCRTFTGIVQPMEMCRDWWVKQRAYVCDSERVFDFTSTKDRFGKVVTTSADNTSILNYTDLRESGDGTWSTVSSTVTLPDREAYSECVDACKVKRPKLDVQVGVSGVISDSRSTADSYDIMYLNCVNGQCPTDTGDIIVEACGCLNGFAEAASIMQTMRLAGADNICSSGTKVAP